LGHIIGLVELEVVGVRACINMQVILLRGVVSCGGGVDVVLMSCWCPINIGRGRVGRSTRGVVSCYAKCYNKVCVCRVLGVGLS
jgi:hypothetical protein